jgi:threonine dehydratase
MNDLTAAFIRATAKRISEYVIVTPTVYSEALSRATGADVFVKYENMQHTGSFKARGAAAKLTSLTDAQKKAGVIAASAGNHAQGVAFHAGRMGIPATIVMPKNTPFVKVRKTRGYGANVVLEGEIFADAATAADRLTQEKGFTPVHPFNDIDIMAGHGAIGFEMMEAVPDLDVLVVPVGGGGLISGVAVAAKSIEPGIEIIGVEAELYPSMINALKGQNKPVGGATMAEGIAVSTTGAKCLPYVREFVSDVVSVTETTTERGISLFATAAKTVAEGAGAAALSALLEYPERFRGRKVGLILSGGNIDPRMLSSILMRDLVRVGQVVTMSIELPDRPGQLEIITGICAEMGANVLEVSHSRFAMDLSATTARLTLMIETRDQEHAQEVIARIRAAGFQPTVIDSAAP